MKLKEKIIHNRFHIINGLQTFLFGGFLLVQSHQFDAGVPSSPQFYVLHHAQNGYLSIFLFIAGGLGLYASFAKHHYPKLKLIALVLQVGGWTFIEVMFWLKDYIIGKFPPGVSEFVIGWFLWRCLLELWAGDY